MADGGAIPIELNARTERAGDGWRVRIVLGCDGLRVEEVGPIWPSEREAEEQLAEVLGEIYLRVQPPPGGLHA